MKRHITIFLSVILLSITVAARAAQPQVNIKCQPQTCTVPDTGGTRSVTIMYDNASGSISTVPDIIRRNALTYDTEHVEKIEFPTYATAVITFKHRPDGARTEDKITFGFTIRVPEGGLPDLSVPGKVEGSDTPQYVEQFCQCELSYIYPALSQVIGGLISASDKAYNPGQRVEHPRPEYNILLAAADRDVVADDRGRDGRGIHTAAHRESIGVLSPRGIRRIPNGLLQRGGDTCPGKRRHDRHGV